MTFTAENNFKELNFSELLTIDGGGFWTGLGAAVIGGMSAGLSVSYLTANPIIVGGGVVTGGVVGGLLYLF